MRIDNRGHILIGTSSNPTTNAPATLMIQQGTSSDGINIKGNSINNMLNLWYPTATGGTTIAFYTGATQTLMGSIGTNATTTAHNTTSDRRVKPDITDTRDGLQKLMELPVRDFVFRADPSIENAMASR